MLCMYMVFVQYIHIIMSISLSARPTIHPCLCIYNVCILCMYLGITLGMNTMCICHVWCLYYIYVYICIYIYIYINLCISPSIYPSMHVCFVCILSIHSVYVSRCYYDVCSVCILFMYIMYGRYTVVCIYMCVYYIYQSVCSSSNACTLCLYYVSVIGVCIDTSWYIDTIYTIYVYTLYLYVNLLSMHACLHLSIRLSLHPSPCLSMCALCVYYVCILCMYLHIKLCMYVVYVCSVSILDMVCVLLYPSVYAYLLSVYAVCISCMYLDIALCTQFM